MPAPPTPTNRWQIGTMYYGGLLNGQPFYTQPGGPGTAVLPPTPQAQPWKEYPISGLVISAFNPWFVPGCQHAIKRWAIVHEFDYTLNQSCALICCNQCYYVQRSVSPYEQILDPILYAIIAG